MRIVTSKIGLLSLFLVSITFASHIMGMEAPPEEGKTKYRGITKADMDIEVDSILNKSKSEFLLSVANGENTIFHLIKYLEEHPNVITDEKIERVRKVLRALYEVSSYEDLVANLHDQNRKPIWKISDNIVIFDPDKARVVNKLGALGKFIEELSNKDGYISLSQTEMNEEVIALFKRQKLNDELFSKIVRYKSDNLFFITYVADYFAKDIGNVTPDNLYRFRGLMHTLAHTPSQRFQMKENRAVNAKGKDILQIFETLKKASSSDKKDIYQDIKKTIKRISYLRRQIWNMENPTLVKRINKASDFICGENVIKVASEFGSHSK